MKRSVYIETSVVSYLTARPSPNALVASCQQITAEWWSRQHGKFELFTSELVNVEAGMGDPILAAARLQILTRLPVLRLTAGRIPCQRPYPQTCLARPGASGRTAYCHRHNSSDTVSRNLGLPPHQQSRHQASNTDHLQARRIYLPGILHSS